MTSKCLARDCRCFVTASHTSLFCILTLTAYYVIQCHKSRKQPHFSPPPQVTHHSATPKMNRDGNDWMAPTCSTSPVDVMLLQPDFESTGFPVHSSKKPSSIFGRRRRVRFARQLTVEARIPADYRQPLARAPPPRLSIRELQERVESLTREVCTERQVIHKEQEILHYFQQEHEAMKHTREHVAQMKRNAIRDLHQECERLEQNILKMKSEMQEFKQQSAIGRRRKRRQNQRELYSDASYRARVPGIWSSRPRMERMGSLELVCS